MPDRWTVSRVGRVVPQEVGLGNSGAPPPRVSGHAFVPSTDPPAHEKLAQIPNSAADPRVLRALEGQIDSVRRSPLYSFAVFVVAAAMVVLPLLYLGLIVLVCWGVYYHATENASILTSGALKVKLMVYLGPLIGGIAVGDLHDQTPLCPPSATARAPLAGSKEGAAPLRLRREAKSTRRSIRTPPHRP